MEIEETGTSVAQAPEDADRVESIPAGAAAVGEFRCAKCRYGAVVHGRLPTCPMCGGTSWEPSPWSPFTRSSSESAE